MAANELGKWFPKIPAPIVFELLFRTNHNVNKAAEALAVLSEFESSQISQMFLESNSNPAHALDKLLSLMAKTSQPWNGLDNTGSLVSQISLHMHSPMVAHCGYCGLQNHNSWVSYGISARILTPIDYQDMLDRGWRRSGMFIYKSDLKQCCCPCYSIRVDATRFKHTKFHKRVLKTMSSYIHGEIHSFPHIHSSRQTLCKDWVNTLRSAVEKALAKACKTSTVLKPDLATFKVVIQHHKKPKIPKSLEFMSHLAFILASRMCIEDTPPTFKPRATSEDITDMFFFDENAESEYEDPCFEEENTARKQRIFELAQQISNEIIEMIEPISGVVASVDNGVLFFSIDESKKRPHSPDQSPQPTHKRKQDTLPPNISISEEEIEKLDPLPSILPPFALKGIHSLEISTVPGDYSDESFEVYKKYQVSTHKSPISELTPEAYRLFLCESPLLNDSIYGTIHQQYRIDGKLVAVGVLDVLPFCINSLYFFYLPEYSFLSLGTYSTIYEIGLVKEFQSRFPDMRYYYMGYYIESCPKMRFKARFGPSELLCPVRFSWHSLENVRAALKKNVYAVLSDVEPTQVETNPRPIQEVLAEVPVIYANRLVPFQTLPESIRNQESVKMLMTTYVRYVGSHLASKLAVTCFAEE